MRTKYVKYVSLSLCVLLLACSACGASDDTLALTPSGDSTSNVTATVEDETAASSEADTDYILPDSDTRYYEESELSNLSQEELRLARNEIYARHGRKFDSEDLQEYFNGKAWYDGEIAPADFDESVLNEYEKANVSTLKHVEDNYGTNTIIATIYPGQSYDCDLDGDGVKETVGIAEDTDEETVSLLINGSISDTIVGVWSGIGVIVNIDTSDNTLQIGVQYSTVDDDMGTVFYDYHSGAAHQLDEVPGAFYDTGVFPQMTCPGDGTIQSYKILSIFESWYASATWMLRDGEIAELVPSVYEPLDLFDGWGIDLTVLQSIDVTEGTPNGDSLVLPAGTKVHMTGTDDQNWVCMTAEGYEGTLYLWVYDYGWDVLPAGASETVPTAEAFDNVSIFG